MKLVSQEDQLKVMEELAAQCWPVSYDQVRGLMFSALNAEYGRNNWEPAAIDKKKQAAFEKWISEDDD